MPISKYNPDGTVDIYNTKTGEVRSAVKPETLDAVSPKLGMEYRQRQQQIEAYKATGKVPTVEEAPIVSQATQEGYVPPKSADQQAAEKEAATKLFYKNQAKQLVAELRTADVAPILGKLQMAAGFPISIFGSGTEAKKLISKHEQLINSLKVVSRSAITGQGQGPVSDPEQAMLAAASTSLTRDLSPEDYKAELQNIQDIMDGKYADPNFTPTLPATPPTLGEKIETQLYDEEKRNPILNYLMGPVLNVGKDIKITSFLKGKQGDDLFQSFTDTVNASNALLEKAESEQDPEIKARMVRVAESALKEVSDQQDNIMSLYSKDVGKSYEERGVATGQSLVNTATAILGAGELAKSGLGKVTEAISKGTAKTATKATAGKPVTFLDKAKAVFTKRSTLYAKEQNAMEMTTKNSFQKMTEEVYNAGKKAVAADTGKTKFLSQLEGGIKNAKTPEAWLNRMSDWGAAYTTKGAVRSAKEAQLMNELYKAGLKGMQKYAPEAYKYRRLIFMQGKVGDSMRKLLVPALFAVGLGVIGTKVASGLGDVKTAVSAAGSF